VAPRNGTTPIDHVLSFLKKSIEIGKRKQLLSLSLKRIPPKRPIHNIANTIIDWFVRIRQNIKERLHKGDEGAQELPKGTNGTARRGTKDRIHAVSRYTKLPTTD
jgi:hypothetical protein